MRIVQMVVETSGIVETHDTNEDATTATTTVANGDGPPKSKRTRTTVAEHDHPETNGHYRVPLVCFSVSTSLLWCPAPPPIPVSDL